MIRTLRTALACALIATATGCQHNLQRPYVEAMEQTRVAIEGDVTAGLYKPDKYGRATLDKWATANTDAAAALDAQEAK